MELCDVSIKILQKIEDLQQIFAIYVLAENEEDSSLFNKQSKIKGYYTNINKCQLIVPRDLIAYMNISSNLTTPDPMFVYSQLISEFFSS